MYITSLLSNMKKLSNFSTLHQTVVSWLLSGASVVLVVITFFLAMVVSVGTVVVGPWMLISKVRKYSRPNLTLTRTFSSSNLSTIMNQ